jgi:acetoin utilization deacetylase AcuC-like enzyme
MLPFRLIYHPGYDLNLGAHVYPSRKYRLVRDHLIDDGTAHAADFVAPAPASDEDILRVHDAGWVHRLKTGTMTEAEMNRLEIPYSPQMVNGFWLATGGTVLAARNALRDRIGFNIGGGFHHAFPGHGEGFCAIHDVAVAIRALQREKMIERAMVVDCDVHHGNGTAAIFAGDRSVLTLSLHQFNNYPSEKPSSTIDVHLSDGIGDDEYLERLYGALDLAMGFGPHLIVYIAGADPYRDDQLGGLKLTFDGLKERDRLVFDTALKKSVPVAVTLAGGYARNTDDTVAIHCNTVKEAAAALMQESKQQQG